MTLLVSREGIWDSSNGIRIRNCIIPSLDYARERKEKRTVSNWRGWPEPFTKDRFESSGAIREITTSSLGWPLLSAQLIYDDRAEIELERFRRWDSFNYGSSSPSYYLTGNYFNSRPFTVLVIIHITLHATLQRFKVHFSPLSDINNFVIWIVTRSNGRNIRIDVSRKGETLENKFRVCIYIYSWRYRQIEQRHVRFRDKKRG